MKLKYYLLDVFTDRMLEGNPLAVVRQADALTDEQMQKIAAEFNLSETVFVRQPRLDYHAAELRIFTPTSELPFAGHPTVGAAVLLGLEQRLSGLRLEEKVGVVTCVMEKIGRRTGKAHFSLPKLPERLGDLPPTDVIAPALGLEVDDIGSEDLPGGIYTAGVAYYCVPLRSIDALERIRIERRGWPELFPADHHSVYAYVPTPGEKNTDFATRMFAPSLGIGEDPATGSAAAAFIGLLAAHTPNDGKFDFSLRQGFEMGRPSRITVRFTLTNGALERAGIGGSAILIAEGELDLAEA